MKVLIFVFSLCFLSLSSAQAASAGDIVINEIAWMGTLTSANDEWIELFNNTPLPINFDGWILKASDGSPKIKLTGTIPGQGFWLLERTDDDSAANIAADQIYTGALNNKGEKLELYDNSGNLIDSVDAASGWPAGDNTTKQTMSRLAVDQWRSSKEPGGTPGGTNTFAADMIEAKEASPQSVGAKPQTSELKTNMGLAAVEEPIRQAQSKQAPILLALAVAIFFGAIIFVLKKSLK